MHVMSVTARSQAHASHRKSQTSKLAGNQVRDVRKVGMIALVATEWRLQREVGLAVMDVDVGQADQCFRVAVATL
jgi:hypothetical protein